MTEHSVEVSFGEPPTFHSVIPRSQIEAMRRLPDLKGLTRGVHGRRGRWLVNRAGSGLVELRIQPPASAVLDIARAIGGQKVGKISGWLVRRFSGRQIALRRLTISLKDPDGFMESLKG